MFISHICYLRLVGVVNRRDLLRGLAHPFLLNKSVSSQITKFLPYGSDQYQDLTIPWSSFFYTGSIKASNEPVRTVMKEIKGTIQIDSSLSSVITTMIKEDIDLVPVMDGNKMAGVIIMSEIFEIIAQFILEQGNE